MMDSRPKIMVVDDDPGMRLTLEGIIEKEGFEVVVAADGYQAIRLATDAYYPLIFMDFMMPGINGVETYRKIKKIRPGSVVVMLTGFSVAKVVADALEEGAHAVVYTPSGMDQIIESAPAGLETAIVLVADTRAADRGTLRAILEGRGAEAVQTAAARHCNVMLLDLKMPGMDGIATLERITTFDSKVPVVFVSGFELEEPLLQGLRRGAYAVLAKPADPEKLLVLIRSITGKSKTHDLSEGSGS